MAVLLDPDTSELIFQFEGNKQLSSSIRLRNTIENHVAFKILCTRPRRYGVQPWIGIISPGGCCEVTVFTTHAPRRAPINMQTWESRDIFKIQSVLARPGTTKEDAPTLFNSAVPHMIEESRVRVVYTLPQAQVAALDAHNPTESSLATTSEVTNSVGKNHHNELQVDESGSIVEASTSQVVHNSVRCRNIQIGALILKCFICTFIVVVSYYLMKQTFSLIRTLTKSMVMLMMKMVTKLVSESIEDWVAKTLICVFMSLVCKYNRVMDLTNWKTKFIQNANKLKDKMINFNLLDFLESSMLYINLKSLGVVGMLPVFDGLVSHNI